VLNRTFSDRKFNSSFNSEEQEPIISLLMLYVKSNTVRFEESNGNFNYEYIFVSVVQFI
jgi:hypothetical protein